MKIIISDTYSQWATDDDLHSFYAKNKKHSKKIKLLKMTDPHLIKVLEEKKELKVQDFLPLRDKIVKEIGFLPDGFAPMFDLKVMKVYETFRIGEYDGSEFIVLKSEEKEEYIEVNQHE